jgi:hypothetical protein
MIYFPSYKPMPHGLNADQLVSEQEIPQQQACAVE